MLTSDMQNEATLIDRVDIRGYEDSYYDGHPSNSPRYVDWLKELDLLLEMAQVAVAEKAYLRTEHSMETKWTAVINALWARPKYAVYQKPKWQSVHNKLKIAIEDTRKKFGTDRKNLTGPAPPTDVETLLLDMADDIECKEINPGLRRLKSPGHSLSGHGDYDIDEPHVTIQTPYMTAAGFDNDNTYEVNSSAQLPYVDWLKEPEMLHEMAQVAHSERAFIRTEQSMETKWTTIIDNLWQRSHFLANYTKPKWQSVHNKLRTAIDLTRKKFPLDGPDRKELTGEGSPSDLEHLLLDMADEIDKKEQNIHHSQSRKHKHGMIGMGYDMADLSPSGDSFMTLGGLQAQTPYMSHIGHTVSGHGLSNSDDAGYAHAYTPYADISSERGTVGEQTLSLGPISGMGMDVATMNVLKTDDRFVELLLEERRADLKRKNDEHEEEMAAKRAKRQAEEDSIRQIQETARLKQESEYNLLLAQAKAAEATAAAQQAQAEAQKAQSTMTWEIVNMIRDLKKG